MGAAIEPKQRGRGEHLNARNLLKEPALVRAPRLCLGEGEYTGDEHLLTVDEHVLDELYLYDNVNGPTKSTMSRTH